MEERVQKILARAGLGSRRESEAYIVEGRVTVNGQVATLGSKADPEKDQVLLDGKPINAAEAPVYVALNKPRGVISAASSPDTTRPTVRDLVPVSGRLYPVGRLDVDSEGLILLTNDGELTNQLTHPRFEHEKEYRVLVARHPDAEQLSAWEHGVVLEDGYRTQPAQVEIESLFGKGAWLRVILKEGKKRQIREMGERTGLPVVRIIRTRIGALRLGNLLPRQWRYLTADEIADLKYPGGRSKEKSRVVKEKANKKSAVPGPRARREAGGRGPRTPRSERPAKGGRPPKSAPPSTSARPSKSPRTSNRPSKPRTGGGRPSSGAPRKPRGAKNG